MSCNGSMWYCITSCISDIPLAAMTMVGKGSRRTLPPAMNGRSCSPMKIVQSAIGLPFLRACLKANRHFPSVQLGQRSG